MIPYRIARELVYQLDRSHQQERLATMLSTIQMFVVLYTGETREEVLVLWKRLTDAGHDLVEAYHQSMDVYRSEGQSDESLADALKKLGGLLEAQSYWPAAEEMMRELLEVAVRLGDRVSQAQAHSMLGALATRQGRYDEAIDEVNRALVIAQSVEDRQMESYAIGNMGEVCRNRGEYDRALECYERQRAICEELGDQHGISAAINNIGIVYANRGEYHLAMGCFERCQAINEELGDRQRLSTAISGMGVVYSDRGEYDRAMECYERQRAINEELGNRYGLSFAIGNMGLVYGNRGEYDRAMECYEQQRAISEGLGDRRGLNYAIGNMGNVYADCGDYDRALEYYRMALEGHRAIGHPRGMTSWLQGSATVLLEVVLSEQEPSEYLMSYLETQPANWREAALMLAREHADECLKLSEQLSKPDTLFAARVLLARIDTAEGKSAAAIEQLEGMLAEATDDEQRAELHYWLWKLSRDEGRAMRVESESSADSSLSEHHTASLRLYEQLVAKTPKYEYRKRIEELSTPITIQATEANDATN